jgi:hypothetical protein
VCSIVRRGIGGDGGRGFGRVVAGRDRRRECFHDVVIRCTEILGGLHSLLPNPEKATGGSG